VSPLESVGSLDARPKAEHRSESNAHERGSQRLAISASDHRTAKRSGGRMLRLLVFEASITACSHSQTGPNAVNTDTNDAVLGECTELLTAPSLLPTDLN
jgi:cation transport regulator ChaC